MKSFYISKSLGMINSKDKNYFFNFLLGLKLMHFTFVIVADKPVSNDLLTYTFLKYVENVPSPSILIFKPFLISAIIIFTKELTMYSISFLLYVSIFSFQIRLIISDFVMFCHLQSICFYSYQ